jgi:hypothetical protein
MAVMIGVGETEITGKEIAITEVGAETVTVGSTSASTCAAIPTFVAR